ncbi:class I SAM-dependent methyltransferase [Nonomuraea jiangxiensis]|uniref:Methyltransferase domain-containing protein n=1 Tax=Nonomuraea jiangxiensis TaxID=633440 RepID=A0A1G8PYF8_9ACTN|nr:class I SAM-dependent methyltransferase [Nonomuraea jiangxiensis]SDI97511.1 Methyltransferase domain-containing protein [Nonomuraea jiangxiensis]
MEDPIARTTATYDRIAPAFASRSENPDAAFRAFRARFAAALPAGGRVADLGCGPGRDAAWFREQGLVPVGVDRSAAMGVLAADRGVPVALGDLRHPPLAPGSLDGLWSVAALLHVPAAETAATLRAWHAALRPGGVLGLSTSIGDGEVWEPVPHDEGLLRWFVHREPRTLLAALTEIGFEVREHAETTTHRTWLNVLAIRREV